MSERERRHVETDEAVQQAVRECHANGSAHARDRALSLLEFWERVKEKRDD